VIVRCGKKWYKVGYVKTYKLSHTQNTYVLWFLKAQPYNPTLYIKERALTLSPLRAVA